MDLKKKILIVHASAGHGHENAAKAVDEACRKITGDPSNIRCINALDFTSSFFAGSYQKTYLFLIDRLPKVWGFFYFLLDRAAVYAFVKPFRRGFNAFFAGKLDAFFVAENPSVIVCTHFLSVEVAAALKKSGKISSKLVVVVTDYLPHSFWLSGAVDLYAVALEETKDELVKRGIKASKIQVTGIPIESKFSLDESREAAAKSLGLGGGLFTVLLTSGGAGIGQNGEIARRLLLLDRKPQILLVCGNNRVLFDRMSLLQKNAHELKVFGFVGNMETLMAASDLVIGKSGGLTLTESLSKGKPMIIVSPVPGQETRNARCVLRYHAGAVTSSVSGVVDQISKVMNHPELLGQWKEGVAKMARPQAANQIAKWVMNSDGF